MKTLRLFLLLAQWVARDVDHVVQETNGCGCEISQSRFIYPRVGFKWSLNQSREVD